MGQLVTLHDRQFKPYISQQQIAEAVKRIAEQIELDYKDELPFFLVVLNGAFMFATDLLRSFNRKCELAFIKAASYSGVKSSGQVNLLIGLAEDVKDKRVLIVEDIVETGSTVEKLVRELHTRGVKDVKVASLLLKTGIYIGEQPINYSGLHIGNEFVVGYGLDYNGLGRNLKEIYVLE
ncbi:MAG TPA: hypoxanthine phosphoribosyltransferase [Bacteroidia bacterium]|nr:hypoxanthine phosphoribosyltransferase [Bacteroidia bacterium]